MIVSLIILGALVLVGAVLYVLDVSGRGRPSSQSNADTPPYESNADAPPSQSVDDGCCGMHITCERDSLIAAVSPEVVYYDDEELDTYRGRQADGYNDREIEQFRDVLLTLLPTDIAGWARSLQLRGITLPDCVRDELLMIVSEARLAHEAPQ